METTHLQMFIGDSPTLSIPLTWDGAAFSPGVAHSLIFTAKYRRSDIDSSAVIQKTNGAGITVSGSTASVVLVPNDTVALNPCNLVCDIQAQHIATGAIKTVADVRLELERDVTRGVTTSVPVITTEDPLPIGLPAGGTTGQVLAKKSNTDLDTEWTNAGGGTVTSADITDATATPTAEKAALWSSLIAVDGTLTSDGSTPVVFPPMPEAGTTYGHKSWGNTGTLVGNTHFCARNSDGSKLILVQFSPLAKWESTDPVETPDLVTTWVPAGSATGTPVVTLYGAINATNPTISGTLSIPSALPTDSTTKTNLRAAAGLSSSDSPTFATVTAGVLAPDGASWYATSAIFEFSKDIVLQWSSAAQSWGGVKDFGISRLSSGIGAIGNGTAGNTSGSLSLANLTASGTIKTVSYTNAAAVASSSATAVAAGDGAQAYISDIDKPVWSNGTVWKFADGTTLT